MTKRTHKGASGSSDSRTEGGCRQFWKKSIAWPFVSKSDMGLTNRDRNPAIQMATKPVEECSDSQKLCRTTVTIDVSCVSMGGDINLLSSAVLLCRKFDDAAEIDWLGASVLCYLRVSRR